MKVPNFTLDNFSIIAVLSSSIWKYNSHKHTSKHRILEAKGKAAIDLVGI